MILHHLKKFSAPILLLFTSLLAFGLQIPWLGYYLDDWIILAAYDSGGAQRLLEYAFIGNRPLVFWLWWVGFELLGEAPLGWHLWALAWRWLTVAVAWLLLKTLWPRQGRQALWIALLFAVYPLFLQQPSAITFSFHWICFFLFFLSLYATLRAAQSRSGYLAWSALAILANAAQLYSQEFFVGLELIRPLVVFLALQPSGLPLRRRIGRTLQQWIPYLALFAGYLVWRFAFMPTPAADRNTPQVLLDLLSNPLQALPGLASRILQDLSQALVGVWARTLQTETFELQPVSNWAAWAVVVVVFALLFLWLRRMPAPTPEEAQQPAPGWRLQAFALGGLALLAGFGPGWTIGRHITGESGLYNDRFGLAAMFGLAILLVTLIDTLIRPGRWQVALVCLLVALSTGQHFRSTTSYRWSWEEQARLFWQLKWRAPGLSPFTAIYGNGALVSYIGSWANVSAVNLMYSRGNIPASAYYWYFDLYRYDMKGAVETRGNVVDEKNFLRYYAPAEQGLVLVDVDEPISCLWIVSEADRHNPYLEEVVRDVLPFSDLSRIDPNASDQLPTDIFGREPAHGWCYTYQKARLAEQQGDWEQMMALWDQAAADGYRSYSEPEFVPFILAAAHTGRWETALQLSERAYYPYYVMHDHLCTTWRRIRDEVPPSEARQQAIEQAVEQFECQGIVTP